jgi:hypothetical protein
METFSLNKTFNERLRQRGEHLRQQGEALARQMPKDRAAARFLAGQRKAHARAQARYDTFMEKWVAAGLAPHIGGAQDGDDGTGTAVPGAAEAPAEA